MDAVVLAGGYATRLWPVTRHRPKMFLPVGEESVLERIFAELEADDRVDEVYVSTNERFAGEFEDHLADSRFSKPTVSVEDTADEDEKFGVVGALAQLVERENVEDDLLVVGGDNLMELDLSTFLDDFEGRDAPLLAAHDVGSTERAEAYGLVNTDSEGRITDFREKPDDPESTLVSIACYAFPAGTVADLDTYLAEGGNPDEPGWFIDWLRERRPVYAHPFEGAWFDIGTRGSYLEAVAWALDGESVVGEDAVLRNATVGPNSVVMDGAELRDARVENTVVFGDARIEASTVENAVVDEAARVEGVDLSAGLVGAYTELEGE
jgi:glucose-1-phosphate thymidylyltransferase